MSIKIVGYVGSRWDSQDMVFQVTGFNGTEVEAGESEDIKMAIKQYCCRLIERDENQFNSFADAHLYISEEDNNLSFNELKTKYLEQLQEIIINLDGEWSFELVN